MNETDQRPPARRSLVAIIVAVVALLAIAAFVALPLLHPRAESTEPVQESEPTATADTTSQQDEYTTVNARPGEPVQATPYVITIDEGSRQRLDEAEAPPPGSGYYVVPASFKNAGNQAVPLNGQPYGVGGATLEADGQSFEGDLQIDFDDPIGQGDIPAGSTLALNFVFMVPDDVSGFVFTWTPVTPDYPRVSVQMAH